MKIFVRFLILVSSLAIISIVIVGMSLNALVKTGVETMGSKALNVPVTLKKVDISLLSGGKDMRVSLNGLLIKNPDEYETDHAFSLSNIHVLVDRNSVLTNTVVINEIIIDGPVITFEGSLLGSNLQDIKDNMKRSFSSKSNEEAKKNTGKDEDAEDPDNNVRIKKVTMRNAKINLSLFDDQKESLLLSVPDFKLRDISKDSGETSFSNASMKIFDIIYDAVITAITKPGKFIPKGIEKFGETAEEFGQSSEKLRKELLKELLDK